MEKKQYGILLIGIVFCILITLQSVSAADYYVNNDTTHKNISDWMKNKAKNGDNLIFNTSTYELSNTLVISKSVNIKSNKNTEINFYLEKNMFYITANSVNFTNLGLKHVSGGKNVSYDKIYGMIVVKGSKKGPDKLINLKNTNINFTVNNDNLMIKFSMIPGYHPPIVGYRAIQINNWYGNIKNCNISAEGALCTAIDVYNWKGSIINSKIKMEGKVDYFFSTIIFDKWEGNIVNSTISSSGNYSNVIHGNNWSGKIIDSEIYSNFTGKKRYHEFLTALYLPHSKGLIEKSKIKHPIGFAMMISEKVKIKKCELSSYKGLKDIYICKPDLEVFYMQQSNYPYVDKVNNSKNTYIITIRNKGYGKSKPSFVNIKTGKITKKVKIQSIMAGGHERIEVKLPMKYANKNFTKYITFGNYQFNKKYFNNNYEYKFKF